MDDCLRPLRYERYLNNTSKFSIYPTENNACQLQRKTSRVSSAITCVSLTQIGYKSIDKCVNAVCIRQSFTYTC